MEDLWFVYAEGKLSTDAVRLATGESDQEATSRYVRDRDWHIHYDLPLFEVSFAVAKSLYKSIHDGGEKLTLRFFRQRATSPVPVESNPCNNKSPKVEATKQAVKAAQRNRRSA